MSRDGSSGGVIRLAVITKEGVDRLFVDGNDLPGKIETRAFVILSNHLTIFSPLGRLTELGYL